MRLRGQQVLGAVRQGEGGQAAEVQGKVREAAQLPPCGERSAQLSLWSMPDVQVSR